MDPSDFEDEPQPIIYSNKMSHSGSRGFNEKHINSNKSNFKEDIYDEPEPEFNLPQGKQSINTPKKEEVSGECDIDDMEEMHESPSPTRSIHDRVKTYEIPVKDRLNTNSNSNSNRNFNPNYNSYRGIESYMKINSQKGDKKITKNSTMNSAPHNAKITFNNPNNQSNSGYYPHVQQYNPPMLKSEKSVGVLSDTSLKPRKGDKTPKSNKSEEEERENEFLHDEDENLSNNNEDENMKMQIIKLNKSPNSPNSPNSKEKEDKFASINVDKSNSLNNSQRSNMLNNPNNSNNNINRNNPNRSTTNNLKSSFNPNTSQQNLTHTMNNTLNNTQMKNFNNYDIQQLAYDLVKEYSHLKIDKDEEFMRRMLFDIFKRQTKDDRLNKLIERNKVKIDEGERIKAFNRLIEDANRRLEAQDKMETMKLKLEDNGENKKKYKEQEWDEVYEGRFKKYQQDIDKKKEEKIKEKVMKDRAVEEEIVEGMKSKKVPKYVIDQAVKRMYEEAERRKLKVKDNIYVEEDTIEKQVRELTPSKFKKFKNEQKYNFLSDMSGGDASDGNEEYITKKSFKNNQEKIKKDSEKNKNILNKNLKNKLSNHIIKEEAGPSNTEINNRRFTNRKKEKDEPHLTYNNGGLDINNNNKALLIKKKPGNIKI
jgi:hypothetical protein